MNLQHKHTTSQSQYNQMSVD